MNPEISRPDAVIDAVSAVLMVVGALMSLAAAIGLLRFPDLMSRMHAATKPQVLGLFLLLAAVGLQLRTLVGVARAVSWRGSSSCSRCLCPRTWWAGPATAPSTCTGNCSARTSLRPWCSRRRHRRSRTPELLPVPVRRQPRSPAKERLDDVLGLGEAGDCALGAAVGKDLDDGADRRRDEGERRAHGAGWWERRRHRPWAVCCRWSSPRPCRRAWCRQNLRAG